MEAGGQRCLLVKPGGALACELGQEGGLRFFRLLLRLLEKILLLCQLCGQLITLCGELAALLLLGA